jgi:REP element-mobilizing transposase RayT
LFIEPYKIHFVGFGYFHEPKTVSSMEYKRRVSHVEIGEIYFWTATINKWLNLLVPDHYKDIIINSLQYLSNHGMIDVFAFVIMPNHVHLIWRINKLNGKEKPSASFLKYTAHLFKKILRKEGDNKLSRYWVDASNKDFEFWQRDPMAIHLFTTDVAYQKMDYIHNNPISRGLVEEPCHYWYSSAKFYEQGIKDFPFLKDLRNEF